jgi:hypothetical protein
VNVVEGAQRRLINAMKLARGALSISSLNADGAIAASIRWVRLKTLPAEAKARDYLVIVSARVNSCPDTKPNRIVAVLRFVVSHPNGKKRR